MIVNVSNELVVFLTFEVIALKSAKTHSCHLQSNFGASRSKKIIIRLSVIVINWEKPAKIINLLKSTCTRTHANYLHSEIHRFETEIYKCQLKSKMTGSWQLWYSNVVSCIDCVDCKETPCRHIMFISTDWLRSFSLLNISKQKPGLWLCSKRFLLCSFWQTYLYLVCPAESRSCSLLSAGSPVWSFDLKC